MQHSTFRAGTGLSLRLRNFRSTRARADINLWLSDSTYAQESGAEFGCLTTMRMKLGYISVGGRSESEKSLPVEESKLHCIVEPHRNECKL